MNNSFLKPIAFSISQILPDKNSNNKLAWGALAVYILIQVVGREFRAERYILYTPIHTIHYIHTHIWVWSVHVCVVYGWIDT